jgi:hypothetical protein
MIAFAFLLGGVSHRTQKHVRTWRATTTAQTPVLDRDKFMIHKLDLWLCKDVGITSLLSKSRRDRGMCSRRDRRDLRAFRSLIAAV